MTARTLILLRHSKAETPGDLDDFDRRLTKRGESDADAVGAWLADAGLLPDLVLCSPAQRTRQTWHGAAIALTQAGPGRPAPEAHFEEGLYFGGRTEVFDLLRRVPDEVRTVLVVGHNPTMSEVSTLLVPDEQYDGMAFALRTSGIAVHTTDRPWAQAEPGSMRLIRQHTARG